MLIYFSGFFSSSRHFFLELLYFYSCIWYEARLFWISEWLGGVYIVHIANTQIKKAQALALHLFSVCEWVSVWVSAVVAMANIASMPQLTKQWTFTAGICCVPNSIAITESEQNQTASTKTNKVAREYIIFMALEQSKHCGCWIYRACEHLLFPLFFFSSYFVSSFCVVFPVFRQICRFCHPVFVCVYFVLVPWLLVRKLK